MVLHRGGRTETDRAPELPDGRWVRVVAAVISKVVKDLTLPRIQGVRHCFETSSSQSLGDPECSTEARKMQTDVLGLRTALGALGLRLRNGNQVADLGDQLIEADQVRAEPGDPGVAAEPGSLRAGVAQRPTHRRLHRGLEIEMPFDEVEGLAVPDAARADDLPVQSTSEQPAHLVLDAAAVEHPVD